MLSVLGIELCRGAKYILNNQSQTREAYYIAILILMGRSTDLENKSVIDWFETNEGTY
jgi:hypothetical protein